ncbi:MAG TPA: hypothetical protein VGL65_04195 [Gemmatimonadales bacterium]
MRLLRGMTLSAGAAVGLALVVPSAAHAQAQTSGTRFGVEAAYADHFNLGVGAFVKFHLAELSGKPLTGRVSFDYYFPSSNNFDCGFDNCGVSVHYFQIAADGLYDISSKGNVKPYVGAGLDYAHFSESFSDCPECGTFSGGTGGIGLDILGGLNFMANSKLMPFVEVKLGLGGGVAAYSGSEFVLKGGIHF